MSFKSWSYWSKNSMNVLLVFVITIISLFLENKMFLTRENWKNYFLKFCSSYVTVSTLFAYVWKACLFSTATLCLKDCGCHSQKCWYQNFVCMFSWLTWFFNCRNYKKIKALSCGLCKHKIAHIDIHSNGGHNPWHTVSNLCPFIYAECHLQILESFGKLTFTTTTKLSHNRIIYQEFRKVQSRGKYAHYFDKWVCEKKREDKNLFFY